MKLLETEDLELVAGSGPILDGVLAAYAIIDIAYDFAKGVKEGFEETAN